MKILKDETNKKTNQINMNKIILNNHHYNIVAMNFLL